VGGELVKVSGRERVEVIENLGLMGTDRLLRARVTKMAAMTGEEDFGIAIEDGREGIH
jgi:hypothetical protein